MKPKRSIYGAVLLIWLVHLIPIKNAQAQPYQFTSNSTSNSLFQTLGESTDSAKSNPSNPVQFYVMLDFMNFMFFQTPGIGGQFYVGNIFGVSLSYTENMTISNSEGFDGSNLTAQAHLKLPVFQRKIIMSYAHVFTLMPPKDGHVYKPEYAISLSYRHDIGRDKGFVLLYDLNYLNSPRYEKSFVMPSIKILYHLY